MCSGQQESNRPANLARVALGRPGLDNASMSTTTQPPKPKRRWYQFSLKTEDVMKRPMLMLPIALLLVVGTSGFAAAPDDGHEASKNAPPKLDAQIAKWLTQLDSDDFKVREHATQGLTKAGLQALPAVLKATQSKQPEVRIRAFAILFVMSKSDDQATANAVLAAAKEMLKSPDRHHVAQAKKILSPKLITYDDIQFMLKKGQPYSRDQLPERIKALDGRRIAITGVLSPSFKAEGITQFMLMHTTYRKFGTEPPCEMILVKMAPGTSTTYTLKNVTVTGRFSIEEFTVQDKTWSLYRITAASVARTVDGDEDVGLRNRPEVQDDRECRWSRASLPKSFQGIRRRRKRHHR